MIMSIKTLLNLKNLNFSNKLILMDKLINKDRLKSYTKEQNKVWIYLEKNSFNRERSEIEIQRNKIWEKTRWELQIEICKPIIRYQHRDTKSNGNSYEKMNNNNSILLHTISIKVFIILF